MKKRFTYLYTCAAIAMVAIILSCGGKQKSTKIRSIYYWATTLNIDSTKTAFIKLHDISKIYVRFFDVVTDGNGHSMPNATIQFATTMPNGIDIVPTVFVMPQCVKGDKKQLSTHIIKRVLQMCATNNIKKVKEIQIDCDWTSSTRRAYSEFMQIMLEECHKKGLSLSSTIRLHQLAQNPPPADRGVLMMYNTGNVADSHCKKPILDMNDAAPYLQYLPSYKLHLATAYPIFSWRVLYRGNQFVGILHYNGEYPTLQGDTIINIEPTTDDIVAAIHTIVEKRADANEEIVLFDLSNKNIKRITPNDYEKILNP